MAHVSDLGWTLALTRLAMCVGCRACSHRGVPPWGDYTAAFKGLNLRNRWKHHRSQKRKQH
eukprot:4923217-Pyramimonas_sp.AAC.1